jgi:tetratricopeptide (TPR) repeat protein
VAALKKLFKENSFLLLALAITAGIYSRFLFFGHISWDDPEMLFKNKAVKDLDLKAMFTGHFVGNYLPLTMVVHAIGWLLFENTDGGHHAINILLHLVNGILVYKIAKRFFTDHRTAGLTAFVFLLHPLQLESVGWISELKNVLSAAFYFASILFYLRYSENKSQGKYLLSLLFFLAGCLSKSSAVILPLSLICIDIFIKQGFKFRYLANKIPFLLLSLLFGVINLRTQADDLFINYSHAFPYHERLGYAGYALIKYLEMFLFPHKLSVLYPYPPHKIPALVAGFTFAAFTGILICLLYKKKSYSLLALVLLCISSLVLVLQFVPFGEVLYADRYMYIPLVYFSMLVLCLIRRLKLNVVFVFILLAVTLPAATYLRTGVWKNSISLYSDILKKFPDSFVALNSLGAELMLQNNDVGAMLYLNKAIRVSPQNYKGYYNRGLLLLKTNKPREAIASFNQAIAIHDYSKAYVGRASAYSMVDDIPKAMKDALYVIEKEPRNAKALFVLANCYNSLNQIDTAISYYDKSIEVSDEDADFFFKRAIAFGKKQDFKTCLKDLDRCLFLNPTYFEAYYWIGVAKVNLDQNPCEDFRIAARNKIEPAISAFKKYCR